MHIISPEKNNVDASLKLKEGDKSSPIVIGGFSSISTVDYPDKLAAVIYLQGCPWRCGYCHNESLQKKRAAEPFHWDKILTFLKKRVGLLDAVVFSGGEPLTQSGLIDAIKSVRALGFKIGLHTGGCHSQRLSQVLPLVDWVGYDIKCLPEKYAELTGVKKSVEQAWKGLAVLLASKVDYEVRTTVHSEYMSPHELKRLAGLLRRIGVENFVVQKAIIRTKESEPERPNFFPFDSENPLWWRFGRMFPHFELRA